MHFALFSPIALVLFGLFHFYNFSSYFFASIYFFAESETDVFILLNPRKMLSPLQNYGLDYNDIMLFSHWNCKDGAWHWHLQGLSWTIQKYGLLTRGVTGSHNRGPFLTQFPWVCLNTLRPLNIVKGAMKRKMWNSRSKVLNKKLFVFLERISFLNVSEYFFALE